MQQALARWHECVQAKDPQLLDEILAEDCVFYSPVLHTPQRGRDITRLYLSGAVVVLGDKFRYIKEVVSGDCAVLEFITEVDGMTVNGVDIISFNAQGKICEFKVMLRPLKAVTTVQAKMQAMLEQLSA